jgi:hypothetical protein
MGRSAQSNRRTKISLDETPSRLAERQFTAFLGQPGENHSQSEREISIELITLLITQACAACQHIAKGEIGPGTLISDLPGRNRKGCRGCPGKCPPIGRFITVEGVRLHYVERGTGTPLVLLHGKPNRYERHQPRAGFEIRDKSR